MSQDHKSVQDFLEATAQKSDTAEIFQLECEGRALEAHVDGTVLAKVGAMIAYDGDIKFKREGILEHGLGKFFKQQLTGEGMTLMKAEGKGKVYFGDMSKHVNIIKLQDEKISVNGNDVLAFENSLIWDIQMMRRIAGMFAGGLFNITFEGSGMLAFTTHSKPLTLRVKPEKPIFTDPSSTVAWSSNLETDIKTDISLGTFFGRSSGESLQMEFRGDGFVVVQPYDEMDIYSATTSA